MIKILVFILKDIFITNNHSIGSSAGLLTEGQALLNWSVPDISQKVSSICWSKCMKYFEVHRRLPKITEVVTKPAYWYCPLVVTFLYTFKIYCQLYRGVCFVAAFVGFMAKISNILSFSFQITWKSESITSMTSSRSVYTRTYAVACLKSTNSYSRSWCASEFWWTTTRLTWLVHTDWSFSKFYSVFSRNCYLHILVSLC